MPLIPRRLGRIGATAIALAATLQMAAPGATVAAATGSPAPTGQTATNPQGPTTAPQSPAPTAEPLFKDIPSTHWAYEDLKTLVAKKIIQGEGDGSFHPDDPVTRAQFCKMLIAALGITPTQASPSFGDVPAAAWFAPYMAAGYRMGILDADANGGLKPAETVNREHAGDMLARAYGQLRSIINGGGGSSLAAFADAAQVDDAVKAGFALAVADGFIQGTDKTHLSPTEPLTRAQAAVLVARLLHKLDGSGTTVTADNQTFAAAKSWSMTASAYSDAEPGIGTQTYMGLHVRTGVVAVDPDVIPLGSLLYVEGYGFAIAADIGSSIQGNRIDVFYAGNAKAANAFGLQTRKVYLIEAAH